MIDAYKEGMRGNGKPFPDGAKIAKIHTPSSDADILTVPGDIASRDTAKRAISEGMVQFGRIDTLVNNAGIFIAKPFTGYTEADFAAVLGVNIAGFFQHHAACRR
jgi:NAD(P)-dependent dehydrogenase (short-subunit alcohol dehydrogenase family)